MYGNFAYLAHFGQVYYIFLSSVILTTIPMFINNRRQTWWYLPLACSASSHFLNQWWLFCQSGPPGIRSIDICIKKRNFAVKTIYLKASEKWRILYSRFNILILQWVISKLWIDAYASYSIAYMFWLVLCIYLVYIRQPWYGVCSFYE